MKISEIKELSQTELVSKVASMQKDLFKLKFQHGIRQLEDTSKLSLIKKDIARINTVLTMKRSNA